MNGQTKNLKRCISLPFKHKKNLENRTVRTCIGGEGTDSRLDISAMSKPTAHFMNYFQLKKEKKPKNVNTYTDLLETPVHELYLFPGELCLLAQVFQAEDARRRRTGLQAHVMATVAIHA